MRIVLIVALHDLRRRLRDRTALMIAFIAPFTLASIMGLAFGTSETKGQVRVAVADLENTAASQAHLDRAFASLSLGPGIGVRRVATADEARQLYRAGRVVAAVTLRPGFMVRAPGSIHVQTADDRPFGETIGDALAGALALPSAPDTPLLTQISDEGVLAQGSPLGYFGPAMAVVFLFMSVGAAANGLLAERTTGTMARMQAAPVSMGRIIAGKTVSIVALMLVSVLALWGATTLVFHAHWGAPTAVLALSVVTVAAIGAIGLFVTVAARTEGTAQVAAAGVGFVFALLGGSFFPPGSLPPVLERVSLITPNGWALDGFTTLSLDRGTVGDIIQPIIVLLVIGAVIGTAAIVKLRSAVITA